MRIDTKSKNRSKKTNTKPQHNKLWSKWKAIAIAFYITFILLSTIAFVADRSIEPNMKDSYEHHLTYPRDGRQSHYYVERANTSRIGKIDLVYTTASNSLDVDCNNIEVLYIYCRSLYEDECRDVFGIDPNDNSNYYKWYFVEKNHFNVNIDTDHEIEKLSFIDTPLAYKVVVNGETWTEGEDYFYEGDYGIALSHVPKGHTNVDLYFKPDAGTPPIAMLNVSRTLTTVNQSVTFDATGSRDPDGMITEYIFDFGNGLFKGGSKHDYYYSKPGTYGVILTVRDNDYLVDRAYANITVVTFDIPGILGHVPNQIKPEDTPPWTLDLRIYEPPDSTIPGELIWFITGEDNSLYTVSGENSTNDQLIFTPVPDAYGNDQVTLWMHSPGNISMSQSLWINLTPVNDAPILASCPDLILHYDDPYTFDYGPYANDIETPQHELVLEIFDGYEENYISINGLNATFTYPHELVGDIIYTTVSVSDGEAMDQDIITIQVTSDHVPKLTNSLPDIWLYEGTTKYNVFDLDDYFIDPDNDAIYFSYGQSHLAISVNPDHTVDISAASEFTGSELVTFRARDPMGAIAEDTIIVTVLPVNDPPIINSVPNFYIRYDYDYRFDLTPYVHDNDNSTDELTIIPSDPENIRLDIRNNLVIIMNYPEKYLNQSVSVRLTVFDGLDSDFQDVIVTISDDFPPELLSPLPDIVFLEDVPLINVFNLDNYFFDVDGDVLYYTTGNKYVNITINTDHSVDLTAPKDWFGTEHVYFRATDPTGALQQDLVLVTVLPVNDPPELRNIPMQIGNESERWVLDLEPYINDVDNNISELEITIDNDFVVVSGTSLIFLGSRELPNELEITVDDGEYTASRIIDIHVSFTEPPKSPTLWDLLNNILPFLIIIILIIVGIAGVVYRKKSKFTAEELFLIHHGGTLIAHLSRHQQANVDDIIFSGMFTAVQDFIKDTFTQEDPDGAGGANEDWALDELKLGDNNILIERSENTYLAVIFSGEGSKRLRRIVVKLLDNIENKYSQILPTWDGNINELKGTEEILSVLIPIEKEAEPSTEDVALKLAPTHMPQPQPMHVKGSPLTMAKAIKQPRGSVQSKELLKCVSDQTGASEPGLTPWPINKNQLKQQVKFNLHKMPEALRIPQFRSMPKTVVISKGQITIDGKPKSISSPIAKSLSITGKAQPVTIQMPGKEKFKIDPSRSLLQQLAEMDDKN